MRIGFNFQTDSCIRGTAAQSSGTEHLRADIWGTAHKSAPAIAGRMNRFDFAPPGAKLQADGSYALDLLAEKDTGTLTYQEPNGMIGAVSISPRLQGLGWPAGDYYMLPVDGTGTVVVEPGRNHRKVHMTAGAHGWTRAKIAAHAGVSEATVTNAWLMSGPGLTYGTTTRPLAHDLGIAFMKTINVPSSYWFLFERGYDYSDQNTWPPQGMTGESPIHPVVFGAWGTGTPPTGVDMVTNGSFHLCHIVVRDMGRMKLAAATGWNWLVTDVDTTESLSASAGANGTDGLTFYRTFVHDRYLTAPKDGRTIWTARGDHVAASFFTNVNGLLLWQTVVDYIGWREGYHPDLLWNSGEYPQPPIALSQGHYIQWNNYDVTTAEIMCSRVASVGQQLRSGGYALDNLYIDNNVAFSDLGGDYKSRGPVGHWSLHLGAITVSAGYKEGKGAGAFNRGGDMTMPWLPSAIDMITLHRADPNNPSELAAKSKTDYSIRNSVNRGWYKLHEIAYGWSGTDSNVEGIPETTLKNATIQKYAAAKLGAANGTIPKYLDHLKTLTPAQRQTELDALRAFLRGAVQSRLTDTPAARTAAATCTFQADDRGEGFRWDVRLNWNTKDVPGAKFKDNVDLFGNRVKFARYTASVGELAFKGGKLEVSSGRLGVDNQIGIADVTVFNSGQYDTPATAGSYTARGGRLTLRPTGAPAPFSVEVHGDAECLLGNPKATIGQSVTIAAGQTLRIDGGQCHVGVDGLANAARALTLAGTLDIRSTPIIRVDKSAISPRYKQGNVLNGQAGGFAGVMDGLIHMGSVWEMPVRGLTGVPVVGEQMVGQPLDTGSEGTSEDDEANDTDNSPATTKRIPVVSAVMPATLPCIRPFRSGANGDAAPSVAFAVALSGPLKLDLTGVVAGSYPLIEAASITGDFSSRTITGVGAGLKAVVNKSATAVTVTLTAA